MPQKKINKGRYRFCFTLYGEPWLEDTVYNQYWGGWNGWEEGWYVIHDVPLQRFQVQYFNVEEELKAIKLLYF